MTETDLLIIDPLDQFIDVNDDGHVLERVEQMIMDSIEKNDYNRAIHICVQLIQITKLSGLALAKSLYLIKSNWDKFGMSDNFDDTITSRTGLTKATIQRYTSVWSMYAEEKIPKTFIDEIQQMNIKSQIPIAQALEAGYEFTEADWEEISEAPDFSTVNAKLREIRGKEPRSQALILMMDRDGGIKAIKQDNQIYIGWLNISDDNSIVQQAITRIEKGAGIIRT